MKLQEDDFYNDDRIEIFKYIPNKLNYLLDVGCNKGYFGRYVKSKINCEVWGVEPSKNAANIAKNNIDKILAGTLFENKNDIKKDYFDCITFNDVLEHIYEDNETLILIKDYLNKNGIVIMSIPNFRYFHNLVELLIKKDFEYKNFGILDKTHLRFYTKKSIKRLFENCGYEILKLEGINPTPSIIYRFFNFFMFNFFADSKFQQFLIVAKPIIN